MTKQHSTGWKITWQYIPTSCIPLTALVRDIELNNRISRFFHPVAIAHVAAHMAYSLLCGDGSAITDCLKLLFDFRANRVVYSVIIKRNVLNVVVRQKIIVWQL